MGVCVVCLCANPFERNSNMYIYFHERPAIAYRTIDLVAYKPLLRQRALRATIKSGGALNTFQ